MASRECRSIGWRRAKTAVHENCRRDKQTDTKGINPMRDNHTESAPRGQNFEIQFSVKPNWISPKRPNISNTIFQWNRIELAPRGQIFEIQFSVKPNWISPKRPNISNTIFQWNRIIELAPKGQIFQIQFFSETELAPRGQIFEIQFSVKPNQPHEANNFQWKTIFEQNRISPMRAQPLPKAAPSAAPCITPSRVHGTANETTKNASSTTMRPTIFSEKQLLSKTGLAPWEHSHCPRRHHQLPHAQHLPECMGQQMKLPRTQAPPPWGQQFSVENKF